MSSTTELASKLADDCIAVQDETGDDRLFMEVAKVIGSSSQTLEEAFVTEVRTRMAERQARNFLKTKLSEHRAGSGPAD